MPYATSHETWKSAVNMWVPAAQFSSDVDENATYLADLGAPTAPNATGIASALSIAAILTVPVTMTAAMTAAFLKYGRNITVVASGAATSNVQIIGRDYLGQPVLEQFTLNGAAPVQGKKTFAFIEQIVIPNVTAATTVNIGWGDILGLPHRSIGLIQGYEAGVVASGTFVAASTVTPQTATTADPRGTYDPTAVCDGVKLIQALVRVDKTNLYGDAHFRQ